MSVMSNLAFELQERLEVEERWYRDYMENYWFFQEFKQMGMNNEEAQNAVETWDGPIPTWHVFKNTVDEVIGKVPVHSDNELKLEKAVNKETYWTIETPNRVQFVAEPWNSNKPRKYFWQDDAVRDAALANINKLVVDIGINNAAVNDKT